MSDRDTMERLAENKDRRLLGYEAATIRQHLDAMDFFAGEWRRNEAWYKHEIKRLQRRIAITPSPEPTK